MSSSSEWNMDDEIKNCRVSSSFILRLLGSASEEEIESSVNIDPTIRLSIAVEAVRCHVPSIKIQRHQGSLCHRESRHEGLPRPCPWVDDMTYGTVVSCPPLNRDQFRDLFQSFHLAIMEPRPVPHHVTEYLLAPLIIRSRNPFHDDDGIFGQICEDYTGQKRVVDPPKWDNKSLLDRLTSCAISTGLDDCGDSGSAVRIDDLAFHQWYMDDSNFDDAQAYFCLSALVMLTAAVSVPQQVQKDLQFLLAKDYSKYSFRKAPPCFAKISKKSAQIICQSPSFSDSMRSVLMIFNREEWKMSEREKSFLDYFLKTAENGPWFDLCRFVDRAANDLEVKISWISAICSSYPALNRSMKSYSEAKKLIEFYKKGIRFEKDGKVHTFKYWAFGPFFESGCFVEILKRENKELLAFCIGLSDPKHKGALNMAVLKGHDKVVAYHKMGTQARMEILSKRSEQATTKRPSTSEANEPKRARF